MVPSKRLRGKQAATEETTDDGTPCSKRANLVIRVPCGSMTEVQQATLRNICSHLAENSQDILEIWGGLSAGQKISFTNRKKNNTDLEWDTSYGYWKSIPKYWLALQIQAVVEGDKHWTKEQLDLIDAADAKAIRQLCTILFGIQEDAKLPSRRLLNKECMALFLKTMYEALGSRGDGLYDRIVGEDYKIDWAKASPYQFAWSGQRVSEISLTYLKACGQI